MSQTHTPAEPPATAPPTAHAPPQASATPTELVVHYRHPTGILLEGETYPHKDAIKKAMPRWRWFRSIKRWGVPRTRSRPVSREQVDTYAKGLSDAGVPTVRVDYEAPTAQDITTAKATTQTKRTRRPGPATRRDPSTVDVEAIATRHGISPTRWPDGHTLNAAMLEAERLGAGSRLRSWMRSRAIRRPEDLGHALGRARGTLALERGQWPPPPIRGATYGKDDFEGLLSSLENHPVVAELLTLASAWPDQMQRLTKGRYRYWYDDGRIASLARGVVHDYRSNYAYQILNGESPTPALARKARDSLVENAKRQLRDLREALDPSLYDPSSSPQEVYPRLCEISSDAARKVLDEVFGVEFDWGRTGRDDASALCSGETSLDALAQKAKKAAEEERLQEAERLARRAAEAGDLLRVHDDAASRGEVNRRRFNLAYWRVHPEVSTYQRSYRGLTVKTRDGWSEATVRGPRGFGYYAKVRGSQEEATAALFEVLRTEASVSSSEAKGKSTKTQSKPAKTKPGSKPAKTKLGSKPTKTKTKPGSKSAKSKPAKDGAGSEAKTSPKSTITEIPVNEVSPVSTTPTDEPQAERVPGSLWSVEEEGFALTSPRGEGQRVQMPVGHQPTLIDMGKPDPEIMERMREQELAERRATRSPATASPGPLLAANTKPSAINDSSPAAANGAPREPKPDAMFPDLRLGHVAVYVQPPQGRARIVEQFELSKDPFYRGASTLMRKRLERMAEAKTMGSVGIVHRDMEGGRTFLDSKDVAAYRRQKAREAKTAQSRPIAVPTVPVERAPALPRLRAIASELKNEALSTAPTTAQMDALWSRLETASKADVAAGGAVDEADRLLREIYNDRDRLRRTLPELPELPNPSPLNPSPPESTSNTAAPVSSPEPTARLEYVDIATGVPANASEPGTLSTGRLVAEIDGETVEIDEEDLVGRGDDPDPRKRRYRYDAESPADYPGRAKAKKGSRVSNKKIAKTGRRPRTGLRKTFDSATKGAAMFYEHNADFFDHVPDPWDGLRDWMDGIEVRVGRGHRKLAQTAAGKKILGHKHAAAAIRGALAYLLGQAKGRRWKAVPWGQVDRLGEALQRYYEAPSGEPGQAGLYWRPFTGEVRAEDLDVMAPALREAIREQESAQEIGEQLDQLREAYERAKDCLPADLNTVIERRIAEWSRWTEDPAQIPEYACEPDPKTAGYLCNYPSVAGELAQLRRSCEDAYDPNWAAEDSKQGAPGFPDTSDGEDELPPNRTASAKACCSSSPATTSKPEPIAKPAKNKPKVSKSQRKSTASNTRTKTAKTRTTARSGAQRARSTRSAGPTTKRSTGSTTAAKRKKAAADRRSAAAARKKATADRRKQTAADRRVKRLLCSATIAKTQANAIDTSSYRRRVDMAATEVGKATKHVAHHEQALKDTQRNTKTAVHDKSATRVSRERARRQLRDAQCQLRLAQGVLRQRKRDHQRAQTELRQALARVNRREALATKRQRAADTAKAEALKQKRK